MCVCVFLGVFLCGWFKSERGGVAESTFKEP
jgi:hypothetical protein